MAARRKPRPTRYGHCGRRSRDRAGRAGRRPRVGARRDDPPGPGEIESSRLHGDRMLVQQLPPNPRDHLLQAGAALEVREDEWPVTAHQPGVARHDVEARADVWCEVDLVDHEEIGTRHARTAFARDLVTAGDVDDVYGCVDQL